MDQDTRNKLQRATQQIRQLLEHEFSEQLEGTFDILPDGTILPEAGKHLNASQRLRRQKLVAAIEHIKANGKKAKEAVEEYTREAAFTFLNRFVALRMLEARELLQECVSKGDQSNGFREFCGLAPGLSSLSDGGYRLYLESLCDELSVEVKVLFDRRDSATLLWPRRGALTELLVTLGQDDVARIWDKDETIGWVYQYFNSGDERRKMREESQAPRNSHELAVRNQFFTPRYVVEYLTDNTLGRIWYEMRKGNTRLVDDCKYLLRRPNEVFLEEGQKSPSGSDVDQDLTPEELLEKTVYIPHRAKKDPRDLKILDPACGSGHFLLYAFDLLTYIYEEAWYDEASPESEANGRRLQEDFSTLEQLHYALPGLVLAHNLHGIDIDPRAAQIAALTIWMRGQRFHRDESIPRELRPLIAQSHIVCAEPMPAETELRMEFEATLTDDLRNLLSTVFSLMANASEAGSLLPIIETIRASIRNLHGAIGGLFSESEEKQWSDAENELLDAIREYSELAQSRTATFSRRLFADDAEKGFSFITVCNRCYDVVLMNPPFGDAAQSTPKNVLPPESKIDLFAGFVTRWSAQLTPRGRLGVLAPRSALFIGKLQEWRKLHMLYDTSLFSIADLGLDVLDDALVEVAAYVLEQRALADFVAIRLVDKKEADKPRALESATDLKVPADANLFVRSHSEFVDTPSARIPYWASPRFLNLLRSGRKLGDFGVAAKRGLSTGNDFRFLRCLWEVSPNAIGKEQLWMPLAKGGEYQPFYGNYHMAVSWSRKGSDMQAMNDASGKSSSNIWMLSETKAKYFGRIGATWPMRTASGFSPQFLPADFVFGDKGTSAFPPDGMPAEALVAYLMSRIARYVIELGVASGGGATSGGVARSYITGDIEALPAPPDDTHEMLSRRGTDFAMLVRKSLATDETSTWYRGAIVGDAQEDDSNIVFAQARKRRLLRLDSVQAILNASHRMNKELAAALELTEADTAAMSDALGPDPCDYKNATIDHDALEELGLLSEFELVRLAASRLGTSRYITKKAFGADRQVELICHILKAPPSIVTSQLASLCPTETEMHEVAADLLSHAVGIALGRWHRGAADSPLVNPLKEFPSTSAILADDASRCILVDDSGHENCIGNRVVDELECLADGLAGELLSHLDKGRRASIHEIIRHSFFDNHIRRYSKSRRKAPLYWQLATPSSSYSIWLYYHHFTRDTFFKVLNEYVKPKLDHERKKLERVRGDGGAEPTRSQRKEIEDQEKLVTELAAMATEVERIAPLWHPNLNDGVIINFAPLWRLVPHNKSWQKECKKCWDKLVKGEYDWAHLAMHLWPERVVPKCVDDASLAIAHGLEEVFWEQDDRDRFQPKTEPEGGWEPIIDELVQERTSPAVKSALESLLDAPAPSSTSKRRRRKAART